MADRLSLLPKDIFETGILPRISYGDVVRLSGMSKQWKPLSIETPILNFHWKDFQRQQDIEINDIISRILSERTTPIKSLEIKVAYQNPNTMNINDWLEAAANLVECLSISICYRARAHSIVDGSFASRKDLWASPYRRGLSIDLTPSLCLCNNLISLKIIFLNLPTIPRGFAGFQNLKSLCYAHNPNLGASRINQFLKACPNLQNLVIRNGKRFSAFNLESASLKYLYLGFQASISSFRLIAPNLAGVTLVNPWPCTHGTLLDGSIIKERIKTLSIQNYVSRVALLPSFAVLNSFPDLQILAIHGQCFQEMTRKNDIVIVEEKFPNIREVRLHIGTTKIREHVNFIRFLAKKNPSLAIKVFFPKQRSGIVLRKLRDLRTVSMTIYKEGSIMGQHLCQRCDYYMI